MPASPVGRGVYISGPPLQAFAAARSRAGVDFGVYAGGYALGLLADRLTGECDDEEATRRLEHARRLEQMLVDDGALLLKIWLHLPPDKRRKRLAKARKKSESVHLAEIDLAFYERYDEAVPLIEALLRRTSSAAAPWRLVESSDVPAGA